MHDTTPPPQLVSLFRQLGIDIDDIDSVNALREDIAWVRRSRATMNKMGVRFILAMVTLLAGSLVYGFWEMVKNALKSN